MATAFATAARQARARRSSVATRGTPWPTATPRSPAVSPARGRRPCSSAASSTRTSRRSSATSVGASGPASTCSGPTASLRWRSCSATAGESAVGVYVSLAGAVTERLPPAGVRFAERFGKTQAGVEVEPSRGLRRPGDRGRARRDRALGRHPPLGPRAAVRHARDGRPPGLLRLRRERRHDRVPGHDHSRRQAAARTNTIQSVEGGAVERVVRPSPSLVAPES